jgi:hypothetical protein
MEIQNIVSYTYFAFISWNMTIDKRRSKSITINLVNISRHLVHMFEAGFRRSDQVEETPGSSGDLLHNCTCVRHSDEIQAVPWKEERTNLDIDDMKEYFTCTPQ